MKRGGLIAAAFLGVAATTTYASDHAREDLEQYICYARQLEQFCGGDHCNSTVKTKRTARLNHLCLRYRERYDKLPSHCCDRTEAVPDPTVRQRTRERQESIRRSWHASLCERARETPQPGEGEGAGMAREKRVTKACADFRTVFPFDAPPACCTEGSER